MDQGLIEPAARAEDHLPPGAQRAMPDQVLRKPSRPPARPDVRVARIVLAAVWLAATGAFAWTLYRVLSVETPTLLQIAFLVLCTLCFAWVALGSTSALIGFWRLVTSKRIDTLDLPEQHRTCDAPTALLFPVYREDATQVAMVIDAVCRDLEAAPRQVCRFDVFILSDTQDAAERQAEEKAFAAVSRRWRGGVSIYYRWRTPNVAKKAGNIREWVERWGAGYRYFVVLDADSLMTADALDMLVSAMEAHPRAGLIQTVPRLVGGRTLLAQLQQVATNIYGPLIAAGLAAWHGNGGNYWGHNAIVRTAAFADCAGLPWLHGSPPLGGHILSHDFVEAAFLRRGGWDVHLVPSLGGSYEGCPPTLGDIITRDRRWAQGNLQHGRIITAYGLPFLSRVHLAMGMVSYLASPLWALTLLVGVALAFQAAFTTPSYFGSEVSLFPKWPVFDAQTALALFVATMLVVHLPKVLGGVWALRNASQRRRHGGVLRLIGAIVVESVLSTLIAPILMVTQTSAVVAVLMGRDAGWRAQARIGSRSSFSSYCRRYFWQLVWGTVAGSVCLAISPAVLAWMSPIVAGLLLAPATGYWTSHRAGPVLSRLLMTAEDRHPPACLRHLSA